MANTASAKKRARQARTRRAANVSMRTALGTSIKKVKNAIRTQKTKEAVIDLYRSAIKVIDQMSSKMIIHPNKGSRCKKRLSAQIKKMTGPYSL